MRTLVTGGTGFVGSRLVRVLLGRGRAVRVLARPGADLRALRGLDLEVAAGDILRPDGVYRALKGCDRLFHVAAVFSLWTRDPDDILRPAVEGTKCVLEAAARIGGVERVVVTSSAAPSVGISASPDEVRDETARFNLSDSATYIVAKHRAERAALETARARGLDLVVVCPTGIFGPGDHRPTPTGENVVRFLRGQIPVCPTGGLNVVDVDDVALGHVLAEERGAPGERYILGGENMTYRRMFELLAEVSGLPAPHGEVGRTPSMIGGFVAETVARIFGLPPVGTWRYARDFVGRYMYYGSEKAERELGYRARPAREALARSVAWYVAAGAVSGRRRARLRVDPAVSAA